MLNIVAIATVSFLLGVSVGFLWYETRTILGKKRQYAQRKAK